MFPFIEITKERTIGSVISSRFGVRDYQYYSSPDYLGESIDRLKVIHTCTNRGMYIYSQDVCIEKNLALSPSLLLRHRRDPFISGSYRPARGRRSLSFQRQQVMEKFDYRTILVWYVLLHIQFASNREMDDKLANDVDLFTKQFAISDRQPFA